MATVFEICEAIPTALEEIWYPCQSLGMENIERELNSAAQDSVTFEINSGTALTDTPIFAYKTHVRIRKVVDGTAAYWFYGRVQTIPRSGNGPDPENQTYTIAGLWEMLERQGYRQSWIESAGTISKPRVILYRAAGGTRITSGAQITDVITWARACGVPIAAPSVGNIITGSILPFDERINLQCADVIAECLRMHPHAVCWFDYTAREPVFHVGLRTVLPAVSLAVAQVAEKITINERRDILPDGICICYEKPVQDGESTWSYTSFDHAPVIEGETAPELAIRLNKVDVIWATFDLQGYTASYQTQDIKTDDFPEDYYSKSWWKEKEPWLQDYDDADITITNAGRQNDTTHPRILAEGTMQSWMGKSVAPERICAKITVTKKEGSQVVLVEDRPITHMVDSTDAMEKTYKQQQSVDSGESVPEGVAAALWAEWSTLHCEGAFSIIEDECSGTYLPGKALNITGGQAAWTTMKAMISRTVEHLDSGTTSIQFGPSRTVDVDTIVSFFRATRNRQYSFSRQIKDGSNTPADTAFTGSGNLAQTAGYAGLSTVKRRAILDIAATVKHLIDLDSAAFAFADSANETTARTIKPREVVMPYKDSSGNLKAKLTQALASEGYGDEIPLGGTRPADPTSPVIRGANSETDLSASAAYNPLSPGSGEDGLSLWVSLGPYFDDTATAPVLKDFRVKLTFPNAICPTLTAAASVTIDTPET
jgi:hypothetical protein